jgi:hypothetical protein
MAEAAQWVWRADCHIHFSQHAGKKLVERDIDRERLRALLSTAEQIEYYPPAGYPDPNYLLLT